MQKKIRDECFQFFHVKQIGKGGKAASEKIIFLFKLLNGYYKYWAIRIFVEIWSCVYCKYVSRFLPIFRKNIRAARWMKMEEEVVKLMTSFFKADIFSVQNLFWQRYWVKKEKEEKNENK